MAIRCAWRRSAWGQFMDGFGGLRPLGESRREGHIQNGGSNSDNANRIADAPLYFRPSHFQFSVSGAAVNFHTTTRLPYKNLVKLLTTTASSIQGHIDSILVDTYLPSRTFSYRP